MKFRNRIKWAEQKIFSSLTPCPSGFFNVVLHYNRNIQDSCPNNRLLNGFNFVLNNVRPFAFFLPVFTDIYQKAIYHMVDHWIKRFQYNYWANKQVLEALDNQNLTDKTITEQLNHLFTVELMWFERMTHQESDRNPHNPQNTQSCQALMRESQERYATMLHQLTEDQLCDTQTYYNTKGESYEDVLIDLLDHVLNHSEHHRAQIVRRMRSLGYEPPVTDYIFFLRKF